MYSLVYIIVFVTILAILFLIMNNKNNKKNNIGSGLKQDLFKPTLTPASHYTDKNKEFYMMVEQYLPYLDQAFWDPNDIKIYMPYMTVSSGCAPTDSGNKSPDYFAWYSVKYEIPILTGYLGMCLNPMDCSHSGTRPDVKFSTCCFSGVTHDEYSSTEFDRGHMVASNTVKVLGGDPKSTFSTCNIVPQTKLQNQLNWNRLELTLDNNMKGKNVFIMQGPLLSNINNKPPNGPWCLNKGSTNSIVCPASGKVFIPYANWKIAIELSLLDESVYKVWAWIYDIDQVRDDNTKPTQSVSPYNNQKPIPSSLIFGPDKKLISSLMYIQDPMKMFFNGGWPAPKTNCAGICDPFYFGSMNNIDLYLDSKSGNLINGNKILYRPISFNKDMPLSESNKWQSIDGSNKTITVNNVIVPQK